MSDYTEYYAGQDAGTKAVRDLYEAGNKFGNDPGAWDRLIGMEILTIPVRPLVEADQRLAGIDGYSWAFPAGWRDGFRLAMLVRMRDAKFAARYGKLVDQKDKAEEEARRAERAALAAQTDNRRAALFGEGDNPPQAPGEDTTTDAEIAAMFPAAVGEAAGDNSPAGEGEAIPLEAWAATSPTAAANEASYNAIPAIRAANRRAAKRQ